MTSSAGSCPLWHWRGAPTAGRHAWTRLPRVQRHCHKANVTMASEVIARELLRPWVRVAARPGKPRLGCGVGVGTSDGRASEVRPKACQPFVRRAADRDGNAAAGETTHAGLALLPHLLHNQGPAETSRDGGGR